MTWTQLDGMVGGRGFHGLSGSSLVRRLLQSYGLGPAVTRCREYVPASSG